MAIKLHIYNRGQKIEAMCICSKHYNFIFLLLRLHTDPVAVNVQTSIVVKGNMAEFHFKSDFNDDVVAPIPCSL